MNKRAARRAPPLLIATIAFRATLFAQVAHAADSGDKTLPTLGGSFRTITGIAIDPDPAVQSRVSGLTLDELRLTAEGPLGTDAVRVQIHAVQYLSSGATALTALPANAPQRFHAFREDSTWLTSNDTSAFTCVDRANLKFSLGKFDITVGRQTINLSKAFFWSPLDIYRPFQPWTVDRDYRSGVDAVKLSYAIGDVSGIDVLAVAGRTLSIDPTTLAPLESGAFADVSVYGSSALMRVFTTIGDVDFSLQGGKVYGGYQVGGGFTAETHSFGFRGEAAYVVAETLDSSLTGNPATTPLYTSLVPTHASAVVGVDHKFGRIDLLAEYFYNGDGSSNFTTAQLRVASGETVDESQHLVGLLARAEVSPVVKVNSTIIVSPTDPSALFSPSLVYSLSDNSDFLCGVIFSAGKRTYGNPIPMAHSEFGSYPDVGYVEWKAYF